jgi:hypothetical protein
VLAQIKYDAFRPILPTVFSMPDAVFSRRVSSRKYRRLFAVLLFAPYLNAQAGFVEESAERGESLFLDDIPVVLSASRLSQPIQRSSCGGHRH